MSPRISRRRPALIISLSLLAGAGLATIAYSVRGSRGESDDSNQGSPILLSHSRYRKTSEYDPGSLRIYLRNTSTRPVSITAVHLNGLPISVWGVSETWRTFNPTRPGAQETSRDALQNGDPDEKTKRIRSLAEGFGDKQTVWARLSPSLIQPGHGAEFCAKLAHPLTRPSRVRFLSESGLLWMPWYNQPRIH